MRIFRVEIFQKGITWNREDIVAVKLLRIPVFWKISSL